MFNTYLSLIREGARAVLQYLPDVSNIRQLFFATDTGGFFLYSPTLGKAISLTPTDVQTGLTASTTQTRAGALQVTGSYINVATVGTAGDSIGLPDISYVGQQVMVTNSAGANSMKVFPSSAANGANTTIDGGSAAASVNCAAAKSALFTALTLTSWQSIGSAARAA